jgi:hypothetical protein
MDKMKTTKILLSYAVVMALPVVATAQISSFVTAQVDAAAKPCGDVAGAAAGQSEESAKAIATAALQPCYAALKTLDTFEKENSAGMTPEERNYFYYVGGNVIWMTAASETMKNDGGVTPAVCQQVAAAEQAWGNVNIDQSSEVYQEMLNNPLRAMLLPVCRQAK